MTRRCFFGKAVTILEPAYGRGEAESIVRLVMETLGAGTRLDMAIDPDTIVDFDKLMSAVEQIAAGRPVQYVLGQAWFCGEILEVAEGVLIPRGETEELVEWIISEHANENVRILDIGTGSGAIAVTLAGRLPLAQVTAVDISSEALEIAKKNAQRHRVKVEFIQMDILKSMPQGKFDIIVSNPPYITMCERAAMAAHVVDHEPSVALFVPDDDPLLFYKVIVRGGTGGIFYFEVHENYAAQVCSMLCEEGCADVQIRQDIHGKQRMIRCKK